MITSASVKEIFEQQKIGSIAIIDDAFNRGQTSLTPKERADLFNIFSADVPIVNVFEAHALDLAGPEDITDEALETLRNLGAADAAAVAALAHVQLAFARRRAALDTLAKALRSLGAKVQCISAVTARKRKTNVVADNVDVVLLDYDLEGAEDVGELSRRIVGKIYDQFQDRERAPLVILMSSNELDEDTVREFQRMTKVLSGMFYFVPKDELFDEARRNYRLAAFAKSLTTGQALQRFVMNIERALDDTTSRVMSDFRALSISDFGYLKMLRLHEDGQPLGEYLMWLLSAHLVRHLGQNDEVAAAEAKVNALTFAHLPPTQAKPTSTLATLYSSAVMRLMPKLPDDDKESTNSLQFGDLFRKGKGKQVWLCLTPPCDLAFSESRPKQSDRSILFLPGELRPIEKPLKAFDLRQPRTELLWLDDKIYRILWDTKRVQNVAWGKIGEWKAATKVERFARITTPFALDIQRGYAADLTRVGMPTPPPLYNPQKVRLCCVDEAGKDHDLAARTVRDALSAGSERGTRLILGESFMNSLPAMLTKACEVLDKRRLALEANAAKIGPGPAAEATESIKTITKVGEDATLLSAVRGPWDWPEPGSPKPILDGAVTLCHEADLASVPAFVPLRLVIMAPEEIPAAPAGAAASKTGGNPPEAAPAAAPAVAAAPEAEAPPAAPVDPVELGEGADNG